MWIALQDNITSPSNPEEWKQIADDFWNVWNFPMCCGAIDGKHLVMQYPPEAGSNYFNYKDTLIVHSFHSLMKRCMFTATVS